MRRSGSARIRLNLMAGYQRAGMQQNDCANPRERRCRLDDFDAELEQIAMDLGGSPQWVLEAHMSDPRFENRRPCANRASTSPPASTAPAAPATPADPGRRLLTTA